MNKNKTKKSINKKKKKKLKYKIILLNKKCLDYYFISFNEFIYI